MQSNAYHHPAHRSLVLRDLVGLEQLGLHTNRIWHDDPQGLAAVLARYHFVAKLLEQGVRMGHISRRVRAVTHLDVSRADVERAVEIIRKMLR